MRILGIDPGYAIVGWGVIEYHANRFGVVGYGAITTDAGVEFTARLAEIYDDMTILIEKYQLEALSIEKLYFITNTTTAIMVAEARGCILLAAKKAGIPVYEYTPLQVKQSVTGYGRAEKKQIQEMNTVEIAEEKTKTQLKEEKRKEREQREAEKKNRVKRQNIEKEIEETEAKIEEMDILLCQEEIYSNPEKSKEVSIQKSNLEDKLSQLYDEWETLM